MTIFKSWKLILLIILFGQANLLLSQTITDVSWQSTDDQDGDGYTRSRTMHVTINASSALFGVIRIYFYPDNGTPTQYYETESLTIPSGNSYLDIPGIGTSGTGGEKSNGVYDFRVQLRSWPTTSTILDEHSPSDDTDLNSEKFETEAEDQQVSATISDVSWQSTIDQDGDGYTRSRTMFVTINASSALFGVIRIYYYPDNGTPSQYYETTSLTIPSGNSYLDIPDIGSSTTGELSHGLYDFRVQLRSWPTTSTILDEHSPSDDTDLNSEKFETEAEDNTYIISGYVRTSNNSPISAVTMNGLPGNPTTDANGYYDASVDYGWSGTVTPNKAGYTF
ncbi:MAG: hypothetical protein EPO24_16320, partial [Bacteroidetes bacterium]